MLLKLGFPRYPFAQKLCECAVTPRFRKLGDPFALDAQDTAHQPELGAKMLKYQVLAEWIALRIEGCRQHSVSQEFIVLLDWGVIFHEWIQASHALHLLFTSVIAPHPAQWRRSG